MNTQTEFAADAATKRALSEQLYTLVGRPVREVRITRVNWSDGYRWVAMAVGVGGTEVPLRDGGLHHTAALILRDAFPHANWNRAQDYHVATGILREHVVRTPASLRGERR
ncbi:hypothetical protein [Streptomyces sp. Amel2xC10]|uniref:hypothetical protein n=1 Tax=Streptomyces sp. Amel2xC10 TaxID=1305826 RepID=UPI000A0900C8|nr:hypothetical protein [Streptomyces sp. Amel2xC10]SMF85999.1 hypothetical protein SAMN02745830_07101 [Streptomyces sp. Amel2xC10]